MELREIVAANLKRFRLQYKLTISQVAEHIQVSYSLYQHYEKGRAKPSFASMEKLCELYGLQSIHVFFSDGKEQKPDLSKRDMVYQAYCRLTGKERQVVNILMNLDC